MTDQASMSPDQLAHFEEKLRALERDLAAKIEGKVAADDSIAVDNAIGRLTRMEAIQAQAMGQAGRRRQQERLRNVRGALERVRKGACGACTRCGNPIPNGRLEVMPESGLCMECASRPR